MHELAIVTGVVDAVTERLPGAKIARVSLEIGELSGVVTDSVRFCFDLATEGTDLAGAKLEITHTPGRCQCQACGSEFAPDGWLPLCPCGSADVQVLAGNELRITSVQVA
jgi:hydrogenase nickel incorporation protein HypA/HybF